MIIYNKEHLNSYYYIITGSIWKYEEMSQTKSNFVPEHHACPAVLALDINQGSAAARQPQRVYFFGLCALKIVFERGIIIFGSG